MELKNNKSTWAALATLGLGAVAAGATAVVKIRQKQRRQREEAEKNEINCQLTADQEMVYNEAVRAFLSLNERIYQLRDAHKELQPLIQWLATDGEKPKTVSADERINKLADDIQKFLVTQLPFINACISTKGLWYKHQRCVFSSCIVGGCFAAEVPSTANGKSATGVNIL